ncbi:MAG: N-acetylneuraminate synthase family protein [Rickettsiales bacterium]|nr:N-acetylneuraminate synthase family protein [Rickettsiales bacterium]
MFLEKLKDQSQPLIIAEIAQNHDGSLGMCYAYVDALADAGAHAVKFQTHIASQESTLDEPFRIKFSNQDETRYDYWQRMEFTESQWVGLKEHADTKGIQFLSTPFSVAAVELLDRVGVPIWKVGSGDTLSRELLEAMIATGKPIIVSTGMSAWAEIDAVIDMLKQSGSDYTIMQCTSMYPTPLQQTGLNILDELSQKYGCRVGLSDHSASLSPATAAIARGYNLIELHATFDRRMFGPDMSSSITIEEVAQLVRFANDVAEMDANPVDKDEMAARLKNQKALFAKSVALKMDLPIGHVIAESDITSKKPATGIAWADKDQIIGRELVKAVASNRLLTLEDLK